MTKYVPRQDWKNKPAITWKVTTPSSRQGLRHIIDELKKRYNPTISDEKFEMSELDIPALGIGTRVKVNIKKDGEYYGGVAMQYRGTVTDTSTYENLTAQKFWIFFNMKNDEISYQERNYFLK